MSDSDRWWVIGILAAFVIGGLLWLLWSRSRRQAPSEDTSEWRDDTAASGIRFTDEASRVVESSSAPVSTADVTMSRAPFAAEAAGAAPGEVAGSPAETATALAGGTPLDDLAPDAGAATVGSELSDTAWAAGAVDVAPPDAAAADALVEDIERPAPVAEPVSADLEVAAESAERGSAPTATVAADRGQVGAGDEAPTISAFAATPEAVAADAEPATLAGVAPVADVEAISETEHEMAVDAGASAETGSVVVSEVHYGADGHDHGAGEWVVLTNGSSDAIDLTGWRLTDEGAKHSYTFPAYTLAAGHTVRVHMARGEAAGADLYCGQNVRWWNNEGDCAYLYDGSGKLVHVHCYGDATASA